MAPRAAQERDELEEYLSSPLETDMDLDLLAYGKLCKESTWPKLAKMAKQYLAAPFSSAGSVERVCSAAGKMHDDLRKAEKDSTRSLRPSTATDACGCGQGQGVRR